MLTDGKKGSSGALPPDNEAGFTQRTSSFEVGRAEPGDSELTPWPGLPKRLLAGGCMSNDE
jgi:hypothetical protein